MQLWLVAQLLEKSDEIFRVLAQEDAFYPELLEDFWLITQDPEAVKK